ncbi:MAG: hypothetical protein ACFFC1_19995, partial [Promethearchaeota archaeon]
DTTIEIYCQQLEGNDLIIGEKYLSYLYKDDENDNYRIPCEYNHCIGEFSGEKIRWFKYFNKGNQTTQDFFTLEQIENRIKKYLKK